MFFPILLIVVPAAILLACFAWARIDEDDTMRKIVVSCVQVMCLMAIVMGVVRLAERSAAGPPPADETASVGAAPVPSAPAKPTAVYTPGQFATDRKAAFNEVAEAQRLAKERMEEERLRREGEEAEGQRQAAESANIQPPAESGSGESEVPVEVPLPTENPPPTEGGDPGQPAAPAGERPG